MYLTFDPGAVIPLPVVTNDSGVFAVATVVAPDWLLDAVGQRALGTCALHVVDVNRPVTFSKIRHDTSFGRTAAKDDGEEE